jgi:hypothetical protein
MQLSKHRCNERWGADERTSTEELKAGCAHQRPTHGRERWKTGRNWKAHGNRRGCSSHIDARLLKTASLQSRRIGSRRNVRHA